MLLHRTPYIFLIFLAVCVCFPGVLCGPRTSIHQNITDQDLFWGSDQYDFSVVVPGGGLECFWHFAHQGENFYLSFQVEWVTGVGHDRHLSVTINAPNGLIVETVDNAYGHVNFEAKNTGFYQMCFSNFHNRFGTMQVFLSFGVYYADTHSSETAEKEPQKKKEINAELNNTLSVIQDAGHRVENNVFHMFRYYNFGRMRRSSDHFLLLSNSSLVSYWSTGLTALIVAAGYLQLRFLKRLFDAKTETDDNKPRC